MRAARLLQILLILQNRGRATAPALAAELEVTPRTILRDVDAMTEAGLPILATRGTGGGIELGFNYRTRLTGLDQGEAEALAVWLAAPPAAIDALGMGKAALSARAKLVESYPDTVRAHFATAASRFRAAAAPPAPPSPPDLPDPRIKALAGAIREGRLVRLRVRSANPMILRPTALIFGADGWALQGAPSAPPVPLAEWGDINIARA